MVNDSPLVRVSMPVFNVEVFFDEAVQSVLGQTLGDLVLIITDKPLMDRSPEICEGCLHRADQEVLIPGQRQALFRTMPFDNMSAESFKECSSDLKPWLLRTKASRIDSLHGTCCCAAGKGGGFRIQLLFHAKAPFSLSCGYENVLPTA
jgi:glycosyltransferase involved in cell wall biosynthesis